MLSPAPALTGTVNQLWTLTTHPEMLLCDIPGRGVVNKCLFTPDVELTDQRNFPTQIQLVKQ